MGWRTVLVESPDRFARDLTVQLTGHAFLRKQGIALIPTTAPDYFTADTPTAVLVRQVLGAIAEFEKTFASGQAESGQGAQRRRRANAAGVSRTPRPALRGGGACASAVPQASAQGRAAVIA